MRKITFFLTVLALCLAFALPGLCQVIALETIYATVEIPDSYTILTPATMESHIDFLARQGTTLDVALQSFAAEGILMQAWDNALETCLQISALNDLDAKAYFDIDQQTPAIRAKYRREHLDGDAFKALGISYDSAEWKNTTDYGRFLMLKYKQRIGDNMDHRGYARRTIRNGYTITVDYQVYGRALSGKDNNVLNDIMDTWRFTSLLSKPGTTAAHKVEITKEPPRQTNDASFAVEGVGAPGALISGSIVRMGTAEYIPVSATCGRSGNFSIAVELPQEGVYVMGLTVTVNNVDTEDLSFPEITYDKNLLPVNLNESFPEYLTSDKLIITGTTIKGVMAECNVNGESTKKKVGGNGKFSFSVDTSEEGNYSFVLTFTKEGLNDQRYSFLANREWSEDERRAKVRSEAIKPAHTTLVSKIKGYTGRIMGYNAYVKEIARVGENWMVYMAIRKINSAYRDIIVVMTEVEPDITVDTQIKMYGRCTGMYEIRDDNGVEEYPAFDLLFFDE